MKSSTVLRVLTLCAVSTFASMASAAPIAFNFSVAATAAIYNADNAAAAGNGSTKPLAINLLTQVPFATSFTLQITSGVVSFNGSTGNYTGADGVGAAVGSSSNTGTGTLSGITAPNAGYLTGVFLGAASGSKPATIVYPDAASVSSASYSPLLQQVFFIGDGLTGYGTGASQTFYVPTGATSFYLGFSDAPGYNGAPGAYDDNFGSFGGAITFATNPPVNPPTTGVPEPEEVALLALGALAAGLVRRRR